VSGRNCWPSQKDKPQSILEGGTLGGIFDSSFFIILIIRDLCLDVNPLSESSPIGGLFSDRVIEGPVFAKSPIVGI
jgi:hypothetical protein